MALRPGVRLGPYEITAQIGAGGMGEVYRARDTKLGRDVALKMLPDAFANDPERLARFEREARTLAALNDPHIAQVYGFEESDRTHALVMELVDGEDLAQRVTRGPVPLDEAVSIAKQIAEALEVAHEAGIIHRDLKPANIKVRSDGTVKVLDFGLAKALDQGSGIWSLGTADAFTSPTISSPAAMTMGGTILGTAAYMAPEQAKGKPVDKRADIWAFGCVLFEMLSGRRTFDAGETVSDAIAAVIRGEPDWKALPADTPPHVRTLLERCLQKDPKLRLRDIGDARWELDHRGSSEPARTRARAWIPWLVAAACTVLAVLAAVALPSGRRLWSPPEPGRPIEFEVFPPPNATFAATGASIPSTQFALSPDGRRLVFVATPVGGRPALWIRALDSKVSQMIAGTEDASYPFWSPDSVFVGYFGQGKLRKVAVSGGPPQGLCDASADARGGTWSRNGTIVFAASTVGRLSHVSSAGGLPSPATTFGDGESSHRWPTFLPDGRRFMFFARRAEHPGIYVGSLDGGSHTRLLDTTANVLYTAGHLLTVRDGTLLAYPFDADRVRITGEPARVAERVGGSSSNLASFSASHGGVIAYASGLTTFSRLTWFDREGHPLGTATDVGDYVNFRLSPDGTRLAIGRVDPLTSTSDIWLLEVARGVLTRFTSHPLTDTSPIWSPDGTRIIFRSDRAGGNFLFEKASTGGQVERQLGTTDAGFPTDWSADGKLLMFHVPSPSTAYDVKTITPDGAKPTTFVQTAFADIDGRFSPDGRWVAYASDESGRMEVYVQPFAQAASKWQVSTSGGSEPRWRRDGRELFYLAPDGTLMVAAVTARSTLEIGTPRALFRARVPFAGSLFRTNYDVTADGRRFLVNTVVEGAGATPITVVVNWDVGSRRE